MPPQPETAPHPRIYLSTECGNWHCGEHDCVLWSASHIKADDAEYVLADEADRLRAENTELREALRQLYVAINDQRLGDDWSAFEEARRHAHAILAKHEGREG